MKLMNFWQDGEVHVGVITEQGVADLTAAVKACGCEDCKALGIETLTPERLSAIKEDWNAPSD